jgi:hypothetical protein
MAGAPAVHCLKSNTFSKAENSGFKMCSSTSGCVSYGNNCTQAAAMKVMEGYDAVAVRAMG